MKTVGVIGLGRFGHLLEKILKKNYHVVTCDSDRDACFGTVLKAESIFVAVPIRNFSTVIQKIANNIKHPATIIDVCSVKVYPVEVMQKFLPDFVDIIASHPLFGPDSFLSNPTKKIVFANIRDKQGRYQEWKNFFKQQAIIVVEMSPEQHDHYMAKSQGITHLIGRALNSMQAKPTPVDTQGYQQLLKIMQNTCNDSLELFQDLIRYNPYSHEENQALLRVLHELLKGMEQPAE